MKENKLNFKLLNILIIMGIVYILYLISGLWIGLVVKIFNIVAPFVLSFAVAYVVYPLVKKLIEAEPMDVCPKLKINNSTKNFYEFKIEDFEIEGYDYNKEINLGE